MAARANEWFVLVRWKSLVDLERLTHRNANFRRISAETFRDVADLRLARFDFLGCWPGRMPIVTKFHGAADPAFAVAAYPNRWVRLLHWTRLKVQAIDARFGPEPFDHAKVSIRYRSSVLEIDSECSELFFGPSGSAAKDESPSRQCINCRKLLSRDLWIAVRKNDGRCPHSDSLGDRRRIAQRGDRLVKYRTEPFRLRIGQQNVIGDPYRIQTNCLGILRDPAYRLC